MFMEKQLRKEKILHQLLENAAQRWGVAEVDRLKPDLEVTAQWILAVEEFKLNYENEPAHPTIILPQMKQQTRAREE